MKILQSDSWLNIETLYFNRICDNHNKFVIKLISFNDQNAPEYKFQEQSMIFCIICNPIFGNENAACLSIITQEEHGKKYQAINSGFEINIQYGCTVDTQEVPIKYT